jgi:hypothetical protein
VSNPLLLIKDAGRGETPACAEAKFKRGDVVKLRNRAHLAALPRELVVAVAVPPGFAAEYALADLLSEPRPLMISRPRRVVSYVLVREGDPKPYQVLERDLVASGKPSIEIGSIARAPA